jgi:hypothetical protein
VDRIRVEVLGYVLGTSVLAIIGLIAYILDLIAYTEIFAVNILAMTSGLYLGISIVVGGGLKRFLTVFLISFLGIVISDLCFSFLPQFIALSISLTALLVMIRYYLVKDHDSGWFGAVCAELMAVIFLLIIEMILALAQLFVF